MTDHQNPGNTTSDSNQGTCAHCGNPMLSPSGFVIENYRVCQACFQVLREMPNKECRAVLAKAARDNGAEPDWARPKAHEGRLDRRLLSLAGNGLRIPHVSGATPELAELASAAATEPDWMAEQSLRHLIRRERLLETTKVFGALVVIAGITLWMLRASRSETVGVLSLTGPFVRFAPVLGVIASVITAIGVMYTLGQALVLPNFSQPEKTVRAFFLGLQTGDFLSCWAALAGRARADFRDHKEFGTYCAHVVASMQAQIVPCEMLEKTVDAGPRKALLGKAILSLADLQPLAQTEGATILGGSILVLGREGSVLKSCKVELATKWALVRGGRRWYLSNVSLGSSPGSV